MNQLSVTKALKAGHRRVNFPIYISLFIGIGLSIYFVNLNLDNYLIGLTITSTFILMWLWWSFSITKWKIWAFSQVRNVHELRRKAVAQQLVWPEESWFNKTAYSSITQKKLWLEIKKKFKLEDSLEPVKDDGLLSNQTIITNSTTLKWLYLMMVFGLLNLAFYEYFYGDLLNVIISVIIALIVGFMLLPKVLDSGPQITLSNNGIRLKDEQTIPWGKVTKAIVISIGSRRNTSWFLNLTYYTDNKKQMQLKEIDISSFHPNPK